MHLLTGRELPLSDTATYSLAFFVFWAVAVAGGYLTLILYSSAEEVNARSVSGT